MLASRLDDFRIREHSPRFARRLRLVNVCPPVIRARHETSIETPGAERCRARAAPGPRLRRVQQVRVDGVAFDRMDGDQ